MKEQEKARHLSRLKILIKKIKNLKRNILDSHSTKSYSQEGEDMILRRIFENHHQGFYIDVGAHHPKRFSNTFYFYKKGWSGINIDAMPLSMKLFNKVRPRDINIESPISNKKEMLDYYIFNEPALNGFSRTISKERDNMEDYEIINTRELETNTLENVLDQHLPSNTPIDFLTVDVEGLDYNVLLSNNFTKYRPKVILIEILGKTFDGISTSEITKLLTGLNYSIISKTFNTVFFVCNNYAQQSD